jgi:hypothetical protein
MKKIEIITLKALRKIYGKLFGSKSSTYDRGITDPDKASELIYNLLASGKPCMIARYGSTEMLAITNYLGVTAKHHSVWKYIQGKQSAWWWEDNVKDQMTRWSGFFPSTEENLMKFGDMMIEDSKQLDILGSWLPDEKVLKKTFNLGYQDVFLRNLEPFWSKQPWTSYLEGKRVVVVHPFAESIKNQYDNYRDKIFEDPKVLPTFSSFRVVKAVQSLGGESNFETWFEALDYMKKEVEREDFDVCLIGCGAYGFPLAAYVKSMGKQAIHLGGALQLLFGIKGNRWENPNYGVKEWGIPYGSYCSLINEFWVKPSIEDTPKIAKQIEGACYW